jgi:hypothetical protein
MKLTLEYSSILGRYTMTTAIYTRIYRSASYIRNLPQELKPLLDNQCPNFRKHFGRHKIILSEM